MDARVETMELLREQIARIERRHSGTRSADGRFISTGSAEVDQHLQGGLLRGSVHEFCGAGSDRRVAAKPSRFVASILARSCGQVVWISGRYLDLHLAGIRAAGLNPGCLICVETRAEDVAGLYEEVLRERGVTAVVADLDAPLSLTASRRLQLAAESGGTTGFLLHRESAPPDERKLPPSACQTRWRIRAEPCVLPFPTVSGRLPVLGPERWQVELLRQRGGRSATWLFEIPDYVPSHPLPVAPVLAHGSLASSESAGPHFGIGTACA
jgi:protein ImuA